MESAWTGLDLEFVEFLCFQMDHYLFTCRFSLMKNKGPTAQNPKTTTRQPFQAFVRPVMRVKFCMEGEGEEEDFECDSSVAEVDATKDGSDVAESSDSETTLILDPVPRKKPKLWLLQEGQ